MGKSNKLIITLLSLFLFFSVAMATLVFQGVKQYLLELQLQWGEFVVRHSVAPIVQDENKRIQLSPLLKEFVRSNDNILHVYIKGQHSTVLGHSFGEGVPGQLMYANVTSAVGSTRYAFLGMDGMELIHMVMELPAPDGQVMVNLGISADSLSDSQVSAFWQIVMLVLISNVVALTLVVIFRKRFGTPLVESVNQARFEAIFESISDAVVVANAQRQMINVNEAACRIFGYQESELIGESTSMLYADKDDFDSTGRERFNVPDTDKARQESNARPYAVLYRRKNGDTLWGETLGTRIMGKDGQFFGFIGIIRDISIRKQDEEKLNKALDFSEQLVRHSPIGIAIYNARGECIQANEAIARIVGANTAQVLQQNYFDIDSWRKSGILEMARKAVINGEPNHGQRSLQTSFGKEVTLDFYFAPFKSGAEEYLLLMLSDITEHTKSRHQLQLQAEIIDQVRDSILTVDSEGVICSWNKGGESQFGYCAAEVIGRHVSILFEQQADAPLMNILGNPEPAKDALELHAQLIDKHGKQFLAQISVSPNKGKSSLPAGLILTIKDVTEKRQTEQSLLRSQRAYAQVERIANIGNWEWDVSSGQLYWTDEIFRIFGLDKDRFEPSYEQFLASIHAEDRRKVKDAVAESLENENTYYMVEHRVVRPSGVVRWVLEQGRVFRNEQGEPISMLGAVQDITDRKLMEIELEKYQVQLKKLVDERTQELQLAHQELLRKERLATLGQLTATVSHELRNPLGAMRPSLHVIKMRIPEGDDKLNRAIERVDRGIDRCDHIIDELLDFTRITELEFENVNVVRWLQGVVGDVSVPEHINLELCCDLDEHKDYRFDPHRMRRALVNVLDNACQAMNDKGQGAQLSVAVYLQDGNLFFDVKDTGDGIAEDVLPHIFVPLFSTKGFGVGLGMPTVKQIMEQHSGGVLVDSEAGQGTRVRLWFPVAQAAQQPTLQPKVKAAVKSDAKPGRNQNAVNGSG